VKRPAWLLVKTRGLKKAGLLFKRIYVERKTRSFPKAAITRRQNDLKVAANRG